MRTQDFINAVVVTSVFNFCSCYWTSGSVRA